MRGTTRPALFGIALAAICSLAGHADAQRASQASSAFYTEWYTKPGPLVDPPGPISAGHPIFNAKLVPGQLFQLGAELALPDIELTLPAQTQLIGMHAPLPIGCTVKRVKKAGKSNLIVKVNGHICLVDSNRDGKFDGLFAVPTGRSDMLIAEGTLPQEFRSIEPVPYGEIDPDSLTDATYLYLFYSTNHSWVKKFSLGFEIATDSNQKNYRRNIWYSYKDKELPIRDKLLGVEFTIVTKGKDGLTFHFESTDQKFLAFRGQQTFVPVPFGMASLL